MAWSVGGNFRRPMGKLHMSLKWKAEMMETTRADQLGRLEKYGWNALSFDGADYVEIHLYQMVNIFLLLMVKISDKKIYLYPIRIHGI